MKEFELFDINSGVQLAYVPANRFKTNEISICFCVPLGADAVSRNAVLFSALSHTNKNYPTISEFNKNLAMLYGASVKASVTKKGENQALELLISSLDDRFSLQNDSISMQSFKLLMDLVYNPNVDENGNFYPADIEREKRLICDKIDSEYNEKRIYSLHTLESIMYKGTAYALDKYGTADTVNSVTNADLKAALDFVKHNAKVQITVVGNANIDKIKDTAKQYFNFDRQYTAPKLSNYSEYNATANTVLERMDVKQGKLVLGFKLDRAYGNVDTDAMRAFADVFGGGPYSKLFLNVREKLSLCYYCSAKYDKLMSNVIIQCGCEEENMDKAVEEILNQLSDIKNGNFDDALQSSKMGLCDSIKSANDDSLTLLYWYSSQITTADIKSITQSVSAHQAVTKQSIIDCANMLHLDTVYKLCGNKEGE